ncbi:MAG TPA: NAD-dependent epimerase/dehydratase family protein [Polyangiaceae bacterium LLY-WYZ-15_(1-7)]|nr:epimerase [Sandaracinus sp.]HJK89134.1 NAD-dependent epimerase/dehydratase family protein [Polyangiaceae bacterium LLY-WYZ-15_(1-7)]MBJ71455.1 epimerase [Sandaracinus sp.]HJL02071.1 NAD-dependent epimerase/dehydratase family protein [Polyangiaceae bacterium LLY-WYZ-15_(1-7)]HJL10284.1 NAD-dependent epimerase/dehydratase family protein [Polyangiaceae bacterium LLY-WYZ-15_(1-7)]
MHVHITGIAGFLGSHLADALIARGHRVSGNDTLVGGYRDNVPAAATFHEVDCCDLEAMDRCLEGVDVVVHTAAAAYEGLSVFSPVLITQNNVQASVATFTAAVRRGVRRVVYCSSMSRYGDNPVPFREDMPVLPRDPYAISKVAAEDLLVNLAETHGLEWCIAIPHNIIGARQKYDDPFRNVASIMANLMLQGRQPIIYGDGEQKRCFSPVQDVVDGLARLTVDAGMHELVVNVGPDADEAFITINELAKRVAVAVGFEGLAPQYVDPRPCEVRLAHCSAERARERLGYAPKRTLDEALGDIVAWIRERGPRPFTYHLPVEIRSAQTPRTWTDRLF